MDGKTELKYKLENTFHNMRVIEACYESVRSDKALTISYIKGRI